ncbi:MAG TPA: isoaspartyl peptidase/L-asparaginase, partial [Bacteroidales bacterium]|nr:isoaspartyl peptidase/L-asparaginase [Bacteroidales bacterium]
LIGAGTYANNKTCAISGTGHGEYFIRNLIAYDISALMEYRGMGLQEAANYVIQEKLKEKSGTGGVIGIDREGHYTMIFNTPSMFRGYIRSGEEAHTEIFP